MTAKKTTPKKPARRRGKKKKPKADWRVRLALLAAATVLIAAVALTSIFWRRLFPPTVDKQWVASVLMAADLDLSSQRSVVVKDGVERWKIQVPSRAKKDAIIDGLKHLVKAEGGQWKPGEELTRNGRVLHLVELDKREGGVLRLIFETELAVASSKNTRGDRAKPTRPAPRQPNPSAAETKQEPAARPAQTTPAIAIILDDIGYQSTSHLKSVLDLNFPITFAILPHLPYSRSNAISLRQRQFEVMLHMPMEPDDYPRNNPGEGAILAVQNEPTIRAKLEQALNNVPFVTGVNNHMGSKITANRTLMRPVLDEVRKRGLFYIDSRTKSDTIAYRLAKSMGLRAAKRDVFLDAEESYDFAIRQLAEARRVARRQGYAIVIGHPYRSSLRALAEELPKIDREGFRLVFASELVEKPDERL